MADLIGSQMAHYRIESRLGEGGMGEVYRARDERLGRDVAVKTLPEHLAKDPDRLARFQREAKTLAQLNHPNIAGIHGIEERDGLQFLVLELVEGKTLKELLGAGAVQPEQAVELAIGIASGMEAAHEAGVIHRDLKPTNLMVTADGLVKILDFGLARSAPLLSSGSDLSVSPTASVNDEWTEPGVILGTAPYMSPEQARGEALDRRCDIWSFGVVLYELLTGFNPFAAGTAVETLSAVISRDIDLDRLPAATPASVRRVLKRCLERKLKNRYRDFGDVRIELESAGEEESGHRPVKHPARLKWAPAVLAVAVVVFAGLCLQSWRQQNRGSRAALRDVQMLEALVMLPEGQRLSEVVLPNVTISRDGTKLAYFCGPEPREVGFFTMPRPEGLVVRRLDRDVDVPVPGVGPGVSPEFSPQGEWIAFVSDAIYKIPTDGGEAVKINLDQELGRNTVIGLSWGADDTIVVGTRGGGLQKISAEGGSAEVITELDSERLEFRHCLPSHLPGGTSVLFTVLRGSMGTADPSDSSVWILDLHSGERRWLLDEAAHASYADGQLLFLRRGRLMVAPFDVARLELTGPARELQPNVVHAMDTGNTYTATYGGQYAVADTGILVFAEGGLPTIPPMRLAWFENSGGQSPVGIPDAWFGCVRVSPDGASILTTEVTPGQNVVWVHDLERGVSRREHVGGRFTWFSFGPSSQEITGSRLVEVGLEVFTLPIGPDDGQVNVLQMPEPHMSVGNWSRSGECLVGVDGGRIRLLCQGQYTTIAGPSDVRESFPDLSPSGRWLAYTSNESGRSEVYVRPLHSLDAVQQVSFGGGSQPAWSYDGAKLFFLSGSFGSLSPWAVFVVEVGNSDGDRLDIGDAEFLFEVDDLVGTVPVRNWDVAPDGRFIFVKLAPEEERRAAMRTFNPDRVHVVQNWPLRLQ